ncbi:MAG: bacteriocin fulvocin C-related protein [Byssovorax sp.]
MHARHVIATAMLALTAPALGMACMGTVESPAGEDDEPAASSTPAEGPTDEAMQELQFCECSLESDWCILRGKLCRPGVIPCTRTPASCGTFGNKPCTGWCLD